MDQRPAVLVTGASTGIGAACAIHLARGGRWRVFAGVRRMEAAEALGEGVTAVQLDVTDAASIASAAEWIGAELGSEGGSGSDGSGRLAGLVNNAGIAVGGPVEAVTIARWREQFEVNVFGLVAVTQAMLPLMRRCGTGAADESPVEQKPRAGARIVNISSVSGLVAYPFLAPYAASKHAVEAISDALRIELAPWNIKVALVEPGPIATPIWAKSHAAMERDVAAWRPEMEAMYGEASRLFAEVIAESERRAIPVERVADVVEHALMARRPRTRYRLGPGSGLAGLRKFIPDRWWDGLVAGELKRRARGKSKD